jgi:hypothetical protein
MHICLFFREYKFSLFMFSFSICTQIFVFAFNWRNFSASSVIEKTTQ